MQTRLAFADRIDYNLVNTWNLSIYHHWIKQNLWASESLTVNFNQFLIRKLVFLLEFIFVLCSLTLILEILGNIAQFLLNLSYCNHITRSFVILTNFVQQFAHILGQLVSAEVVSFYGLMQNFIRKDGNGLDYSFTNIENNATCTTCFIQCQQTWIGETKSRCRILLKNYLHNILSVYFWISSSFLIRQVPQVIIILCSDGLTLSQLAKQSCSILLQSYQSVTIPFFIGYLNQRRSFLFRASCPIYFYFNEKPIVD